MKGFRSRVFATTQMSGRADSRERKGVVRLQRGRCVDWRTERGEG